MALSASPGIASPSSQPKPFINPSDISFGLTTDDDIEDTKTAYKDCTALTSQTVEQKALWKVIATGRKNDVPQLLTLLFSVYSRARIEYFIRTKNNLPFGRWIKQSPLIKAITTNQNNSNPIISVEDLVKSALDTFQRRFMRPIMLPIHDNHKINDNILIYAKHISDTIKLLKSLPTPAQIDLWIIPKGIGPDADPDDNDDDNDDDFDDDGSSGDDSDSDDDDDAKNNDNDNKSNMDADIGDIESTLKHYKCTYVTNKSTKQGLNVTYRPFLQKIQKTKYNRFCVIVERNQTNMVNALDDIIYFYIPVKYNKIQNGIPEWFIESSISDILPAANGISAITAKTAVNNKMFLLSLHMEHRNEIRAWIYHKAQIFRFQPNDLLNLFPLLFIKALSVNDKKKLKKIINDCQIPDVRFQQFNKK